MTCVAPSFHRDVSVHMFCVSRFSLKSLLRIARHFVCMASSDSPLGHLGDQIVTPKIPQSWLVQSKAVDMTNVDLAKAFSSDHVEADSLLLELAKKSIDKQKNAGDEVATTTSKHELELRAAMDAGFSLHSALGQRFTRLVREQKKRGSTEFDDYTGTAQQKEAVRARWAKKQYDEVVSKRKTTQKTCAR